MRTATHRVLLGLTGVAAVGAAGIGYSVVEATRLFRLRRVEVPVLAPGAAPLRILQISDLHLTPGQRNKAEWVRDLARLSPDLVVNCGDNLAALDAVPSTLRALEPLFAYPGLFVLGSNDYFAPRPKNPARYLFPGKKRPPGQPLPWQGLAAAMRDAGWHDLTNRTALVKVGPRLVDARGVDDPHLDLDRADLVSGPFDPAADLHLAVTHSPEPRVLDAFVADGAQLVLAGHTHGGQLRVPFYGALVTNSGLDTGRARGLSEWCSRGRCAHLHVSAGLGTSPYTPVRFACPPEATLLTLTPRPVQ
jgi:predicted MPP superfamily phosphohydrolase